MNKSEVGEIIKKRREFLEIRQQDLAEMSGITIRTIHAIESGSANASFENLEKIATVLGLEIKLEIKKVNG